VCELRFNQLARARFSEAARARHKKLHSYGGLAEALVGGNSEIRRLLKLVFALFSTTIGFLLKAQKGR